MTGPGIFRPKAFRDNDSFILRNRYKGSAVFRRTDCWDIVRGGSQSNSRSSSAHGINEPSIYSWRKKLGDPDTDDVKRLKQLAQESGRLKKILV